MNEFQLAYDASRMYAAERKSAFGGKLAALMLAGKFVVVADVPDYCPSTDASMGYRTALMFVGDSRWEAEKIKRNLLTVDGDIDDDICNVQVLPFKV